MKLTLVEEIWREGALDDIPPQVGHIAVDNGDMGMTRFVIRETWRANDGLHYQCFCRLKPSLWRVKIIAKQDDVSLDEDGMEYSGWDQALGS